MGWPRDVLVSSAAGYAATRAMDASLKAFYKRQSEATRRREKELRDATPTAVLVQKVAHRIGRKIDDERAERFGSWVHYGFGASGGPVVIVLMRSTGMGAMSAALATAGAMWVFVDEGANYLLGLAAPPGEWPAAAHVRGFVGHLAYGLALGALLALAGRTVGVGRHTGA